MGDPMWREEGGGILVAEIPGFCLNVRWAAGRKHARFTVRKRLAGKPPILVASGTTDELGRAMSAAQELGERLRDRGKDDRPLVMVVDDDAAVRGAVADALRDDGYNTIEAASGEGALRRLERVTSPTILVTDLHLGAGMNGLELSSIVRSVSPAIGLVLMSADMPDSDDVGPHAYLRKPFSSEQLLAGVAASVRQIQH